MTMFVKEETPESITLFPTLEEKRTSRSLDLSVNTTSTSTSTTSSSSGCSSTTTTATARHHKRSTSAEGCTKNNKRDSNIMILTSSMPAQNTEDSLSAVLPSPTSPNTAQHHSGGSGDVSPTNSSSLLFNFGLASRKQSFCSILQQKVRNTRLFSPKKIKFPFKHKL